MSRLARDSAAIAVLGGGLLGVLWWLWLPDDLLYVVVDGQPFLDAANRGMAFDVDGRLAVLCVMAGLASGVFLWWRHRDRPAATIPAAAFVGLTGSAIAAWLGAWLGPEDLDDRAAVAANGETIGTDLMLSSPAVLLLWPMTSLVVILMWVGVNGLLEQAEQTSPQSLR